MEQKLGRHASTCRARNSLLEQSARPRRDKVFRYGKRSLSGERKPRTFPTLYRGGEDTTGHRPLSAYLGENVREREQKACRVGLSFCCLPGNGDNPQTGANTFKRRPLIPSAQDTKLRVAG